MDRTKSSRPWLRLNLDEMTPDLDTVMSFRHQCYRLVPELSPEKDRSPAMIGHSTPNNQGCRRQLPKIPKDLKPLEKSWNLKQPIEEDIGCKLQRWTKKLSSTNMLLEIKTNPTTGKTLSIRMVDDDNSDRRSDIAGGMVPKVNFSPQMDDEDGQAWLSRDYGDGCCAGRHLSDEEDDTMAPHHHANSQLPSQPSSQTPLATTISSNDSGLSSNMQSPSVTFNDKIEFSDPDTMEEDATHRVLFKFCARHPDEIDLEIGDPVHVYQEFDDQWSSGRNIRTKARGIFPSSVVVDVNYSEFLFDQETNNGSTEKFPWTDFRVQRERYPLDFLGSIEVHKAKGEDVLDDAIRRVTLGTEKPSNIGNLEIPFHCSLDISDIGIRMFDSDPGRRNDNRHDYFFALVQITYCGYQLKNHRYYFAFITRHPAEQNRFACHVFQGVNTSTREVAESVGRAFHRFYNRFVQVNGHQPASGPLPSSNQPVEHP